MPGVRAPARAACGRHHAGLGRDLHGAINAECAVDNDRLALFESFTHDVEITSSRSEHDGSTFIRRSLGVGYLYVHDRSCACKEHGRARDDQWLLSGARIADDAQ